MGACKEAIELGIVNQCPVDVCGGVHDGDCPNLRRVRNFSTGNSGIDCNSSETSNQKTVAK